MNAARGQGPAHRRGEGLRRGLTLLIFAITALSCVPAFDGLTLRWRPADPVLLAALLAIVVCAATAEMVLKLSAPARLDATVAPVLLALLFAGPLPALLVLCAGDLVGIAVFRRMPLRSVGTLANFVSYGAAIVAAGAVLALAGAGPTAHGAPVLFLAGFAYLSVNFLVARIVYAVLWQGYPAARIGREFIDAQPAIVAMLLLTVVTALAMTVVGVAALVLIAPLALLPYVAAFTRARSVHGLSRPRAAQLYAASLAGALGMSRRERRLVAAAAGAYAIGGPAAVAARSAVQAPGRVDRHHVRVLAWHAAERWDGNGGPAGLAGRHIPVHSRIVAVAEVWAQLTARGGLELSHAEALLDLELRAGSELDPEIVRAAGDLIADEPAFVGEPGLAGPGAGSARPVVHALPLGPGARRAVGRLLASCTSLS